MGSNGGLHGPQQVLLAADAGEGHGEGIEVVVLVSFTAVLELKPNGKGGTRYTAIAIHGNEETRKKHEEMGFHDGWGTVVEQLARLVEKQA